MRALSLAAVSGANGSAGGFPTLPLRRERLPSATGIPSMHRGLSCRK